MSTSGDITYNLTTTGIVTKAYELVEAIRPGESVSGEDYSSALVSLNLMIKGWQAKGIYMQAVDEATLFLTVGQKKYHLGLGSTDHVAVNTNLVETSITEDETAADTLIHVTDTTGMLVGDTIGCVLNDGTIQWTTINTVNSSTTVTLDDALTEDMTEGNYVFSYRADIGRPLEIIASTLRQSGGTDSILSQYTSEVQMNAIGREEYFNFPNKGTQGTPIQYFFDKRNTYSTLSVFPAPSTVNYRIKLLYKRIFENFTNSDDNPYLPQEFGEALVYGLAVRLATQVRRTDLLQFLVPMAIGFLEDALSTTQEQGVSLVLRPKY